MKFLSWLTVIEILHHAFSMEIEFKERYDILASTITKDSHVYQSAIFLTANSSLVSDRQQYFIKSINLQIPIKLISINETVNSFEHLIQSMLELKNTRSTIFMFLLIQFDAKEIYNYLEWFARLVTVLMRPKLLLVIFTDTIYDMVEMQNILFSGWTLKYLDFSILHINLDDILVYNYNPFKNVYNIEPLNTLTDVFPDKLIDLYGYSLKFLVYHQPPFCRLEINKNGETLKVDGSDYSFLEMFSQRINFKLLLVKLPHDTDINYLSLTSDLQNDTVNIIAKSYIQTILYNSNMTIGRFYTNSFFAVIVPIVYTTKLSGIANVLPNLLMILLITALFCTATHIFQLYLHELNVLNVFRILLNIPILKLPRKLFERVLWLVFIAISVHYCSDQFATLTKIKLEHTQISFDTIEDIDESGFLVYTCDTFYDIINKNDFVWPPRLKSRLRLISIVGCIQNLAKGIKIICILPYFSSKYLVNQYNALNQVPKMKYTKLQFINDYAVFPYEKACPYLERFDQITQRIVEHGFLQSWEFREKYWSTPSKTEMNESRSDSSDTENLVIPLSIIAGSGYIISSLVFLGEYLFEHIIKYYY